MRREALVTYIINKFFLARGFRWCNDLVIGSGYRLNICDESIIVISFDLEYASDFRDDAYTWCYVDFFIKEPGLDIDDELKTSFTRFIDAESRKIFWRHRELVRIIDMDRAVEYIMRLRNELLDLLREHGLDSSSP